MANYIGINCKRQRPTLEHEPAIWENMLGAIYAANPAGVVKYFDYKWEEAKEWARISEGQDPRLWRDRYGEKRSIHWSQERKLTLYIKRSS
jgi:hypothetical protein